jgi:chromate transporter
MDEAPPKSASAGEVFAAFLKQGLTAFGGPVAHLAHFRREFVERRGWVSDADFDDLLAFCHLAPGFASSQLGMAIGLRRAGLAGALGALAGFTAPAAAAMLALAYLEPGLSRAFGSGWIHGLKVAAAGIVLQALVAMARTLAVGPIRAGMAIGAGAGLVVASGPTAQIFVLLAGALFGLAFLREQGAGALTSPPAGTTAKNSRPAVAALILFALVLVLSPFAAQVLASPSLGLASVFFRTGALAFGSEHVLLPLLQAEVVERRWIDSEALLASYGAVHALPGPIFSLAAFVGAVQDAAPGGWLGALVAVGAISLPSLLLVLGALPYWDRLKARAGARAALAGVNAVVVGLLAAAVWDPVLASTIQQPADWAMVAAAFVFLTVARLPPWLVVAGFAAATGVFLA